MAEITSINQLKGAQVDAMVQELKSLDPLLDRRLDYVLNQTQCTKAEALEYITLSSPMLWAKVYLDWQARDYQVAIMEQSKNSRSVVLRLGRRLGKTDSMCVLILWHAYTQINKGPNNQYDILIITPYETQVNLIFDRLHQLIDNSPLLQGMISRDIHHRIELSNGSKIIGLTAGSKSGSGAANTRGQRADLIVLDEVDYMGSSEITNVINIRNEAPERIKVLAASTPSGKHEEFYKWCTGASHRFAPSKEDIDNYEFNGYLYESNEKGNGWTEIYAPSIVNKELLKINDETNRTYIEDLRAELSEMRFVQEVLAEFGEEEMGVYQKQYIQAAIDEGRRIGHRYVTDYNYDEYQAFIRKRKKTIRLLGVDWDKYQAGTTMVGVELDAFHTNEHGVVEPKFKVMFRLEIPRSQFTYRNAIDKIIQLNDDFDFDWIAIDRGYGEVQLELLHDYGIKNPETGLADKVVGYQFSEKIEVRDPHTLKKDRKPLKPFMVNTSVNVFEKYKIVLNPEDDLLIEQLGSYVVKSISSSGMPTYTDENEHAVDGLNLCLLIFEQKYGDLMRRVITTRIAGFEMPDIFEGKVQDRALEDPDRKKTVQQISLGRQKAYIKDYTISSAKVRKGGNFKRSSF